MVERILYIPLDERPCNYDYPIRLKEYTDDVEVIVPPRKILGNKKTKANINDIKKFITENIAGCSVLIYSTEMLAYGGLLPSRIYLTAKNVLTEYSNFIVDIKKRNPSIKILASNLIMRTPRYSSDDEEPEYYGEYGAEIFKIGWLKDKLKREGLDVREREELNSFLKTVPSEFLEDYEDRRSKNVIINLENIKLARNGIIEHLIIPQDDSAEYGFTAIDQKKVYGEIKKQHLQSEVSVYPGADEAGYTLLANAKQLIRKQKLKVFVLFSGVVGEMVIPLYEDRPLTETVKAHINSAGSILVHNPSDADIVLAVNVPGKQMIEAFDQYTDHDLTYDTFRNLRSFVDDIEYYQKCGLKIAIADSAYSNGGDIELLSMLDERNLLDKLSSYRAWNTNSNTIGSALATTIFTFEEPKYNHFSEIMNCIADDVVYQAIVRRDITDNKLPQMGLNYFNLGSKSNEVAEFVIEEIESKFQELMPKNAKNMMIKELTFPWNRMFEININMEV